MSLPVLMTMYTYTWAEVIARAIAEPSNRQNHIDHILDLVQQEIDEENPELIDCIGDNLSQFFDELADWMEEKHISSEELVDFYTEIAADSKRRHENNTERGPDPVEIAASLFGDNDRKYDFAAVFRGSFDAVFPSPDPMQMLAQMLGIE